VPGRALDPAVAGEDGLEGGCGARVWDSFSVEGSSVSGIFVGRASPELVGNDPAASLAGSPGMGESGARRNVRGSSSSSSRVGALGSVAGALLTEGDSGSVFSGSSAAFSEGGGFVTRWSCTRRSGVVPSPPVVTAALRSSAAGAVAALLPEKPGGITRSPRSGSEGSAA
jgi:hypothetical protein